MDMNFIFHVREGAMRKNVLSYVIVFAFVLVFAGPRRPTTTR
jgi:hypothetical protein